MSPLSCFPHCRCLVWDEGRGSELVHDLRTDSEELQNLSAHPAQSNA